MSFTQDKFVNRYVALIDAGTLRWFDSKIWGDPEKAKKFYNDLYAGSDLIITVLPVGGPVVENHSNKHCSKVLREEGRPYPRTCPIHGLGPC